jgi:SAM-dependent methyltransferase
MNAAARPSVHLSIVQPPGYVHSMALLDAALYFRHQFEQLGATVTVAKNRLRADAPNLVFGAHLGFDPGLTRTFCCLFVNLEQLGAGGSRMPPAYLELLRASHVIDYDRANLETYARSEADVPLVSFGYAPYLAPAGTLPLEQRPFDLLFFGSMNARRKQIIDRIERTGRTVVTFDAPIYGPERDAFIVQSRAVLNCHHYDSAVFEQVRAFQVLSLGTPLVSERTGRTRPGSAFEHTVNWFDDASLEQFFTTEYPAPGFAQRFEQQQLAFRHADPRDEYAPVLDFAIAAYGAARSIGQPAPCAQRLLHIGSGKDYRPGWLNVDIQAGAQPDVLVDLSQPWSWPAHFESPYWGPVQLQAGATDLIYANNVLEHVGDLPTLMRNCLELLRVGGLMVIEVPYEKSMGAWQDPTHVRAMNEHSWLYYTDWFWYLGWFEHRFKVREFKWLDDKLAPCERSAGAFMAVTLEKTPTTVAERMTARTVRPDFGGLVPAPVFPRGAAALAPPTAHELPALPALTPAPPPAVAPASSAAHPAPVRPAPVLAAARPAPASPARDAAKPAAAPDNYYDGINVKLLAQLPQAHTVIEFGCANGRLGEEYKKKYPGAHWTGVDIDAAALELAARRLDAVLQCDLDVDAPALPDAKFDLIVFGDLIEHMRSPQRLLEQVNRLCHEGSRIVCCIPNMSHYSVIERLLVGDIAYDNAGLLDETHLRFFSPRSVVKMFLDAGWLPKMVDNFEVPPSSPALEHLVKAAEALGCPPKTSAQTFSLYQLVFECQRAPAAPAGAARRARFSAVVPVTNTLQVELNVHKSPGLQEVGCEVIHVLHATSAASAFADGAARAGNDWILYCHQDVYLPRSSGQQINALIERLEASGNPDPIVGFAGLALESAEGPRYAGLCNDRLQLFDYPASAAGVSIDECAVLMRRNSRYRIDAALGWHLWATDLCLQSIFAGNPPAEIVRIPIFHNSYNDGVLTESFRQSARVLMEKYPQQKSIPTIAAGVMTRPEPPVPAQPADRNAGLGALVAEVSRQG